MKKLTIILFMLPILVSGQKWELAEDWSFEPDKVKHAVIGGSLSACSNVLIACSGALPNNILKIIIKIMG